MGLKFRRGSTAQQSGSLAFGEPYVNTTLGTLVVGGPSGDIVLSAGGTGSTGNFGAISGSGLDITGNANIAGNLTLGGQLTIGDNTSDTVNVVASLSSSLIPQTTNAFDLGSATKIWKDLYISTGSIKFVDGTTVVKELNLQTITGLESATGSTNAAITNLNSFTQSFSQSVYDTLYWPTTGLIASISSSINQATASLSASFYDSIFGLSSNALSYSIHLGLYGDGSMTTGSFGELSGSIHRDIYGDGMFTTGLSGSIASTQNMFSMSVGTEMDKLFNSASNHEQRLDTIELESPSYARTNTTNIFTNTQTITGSMYISGDLVVQGSSSLQNITASAVSIGTNIVQLNTSTPAVRFAGLQVIDSGSTAMSASLYWDSVNNHWIYQRESGAVYGGGMLIAGPRNLGTLGEEVGMTSNRLAMGIGGDHISSSQVYVDNTGISIPGNLEVTGSITGTVTGNATTATTLQNARLINGTSFNGSANITIPNLVSGSSQVTLASTTGFGTYINQAVLTTSAVTFGSILSNGNLQVTGSIRTTTLNIHSDDIPELAFRNAAGDSLHGNIFGGPSYLGPNRLEMQAGNGLAFRTKEFLVSDGDYNNKLIISGSTFDIKVNTIVTGSVTVSGSITATGDVVAYSTSDRRHKNNIVSISDALSKVTKLNGVTWEWNDDVDDVTKQTPKTGLIAQEVQEVLPEVVKERGDGFLALDYSKMMGLMVEAIKEQQLQIEELKAKIGL